MPPDQDDLKRACAEAALARVESGMVLGLGTGSTVSHLLDLLGAALREERLAGVVGVPTSRRTEEHARAMGIPLIGLGERTVQLTIDGADEVDPHLDLIKGMGGALLREKMVAQASDRLLIIADDSKMVERLGSKSALPIEVIEWGAEAHVRFLEDRGASVEVRTGADGTPARSDNGHLLLDCSFAGGIPDPPRLEDELRARSGVVESGLFIGLADEVLLAGAGGVRSMRRRG